MPALATIGYERSTLPDLIERLKGAGVEVLVDVRAVAASRRPGFSKGILSASLDEAGIGYLHLKGLGTPKAGREAARAGRTEEMRRIYTAYLEEPQAQLALAQAAALASEKKVALLCLEAEAAECHRAIVAERICGALGGEIHNL